MIKEYSFNYDMMEAEAFFIVDTSIFTKQLAQATLDFFVWDYDKDADPIDEVMKKYALKAITIATEYGCDEHGVIYEFKTLEGFDKIDGSFGITLVSVSGYQFSSDKLDVTITNK